VKTRERELARQLRAEQGASIKEIARMTGAAQSSISRWVRDIELTDEQRAVLIRRAADGLVKGQTMNAALRREARWLAQEEGRVVARRRDPMFVAGCMLYWAEGGRARNQLKFTNSDPEMVRFFVTFLRTHFNVADADIRITCNLFADHLEQQRQIEQFWLNVASLPRESLCRSTVNTYSKYSKKKRRNRLPYGTCRVSVSKTQITQSVYGAIQEIGGFERPTWLE
jgi:transcriptional regulator with XRE-family HTH domain